MAFPGNRAWRMRRSVKGSVVNGTPNFDGIYRITHDDLPDAAKTLGGGQAILNGGGDLAASLDSSGTTRLALQIVRCELNATPANSRIEAWVRVIGVSDTVDTDVWLWWGDATETQPAVTANYGRNDVWNGTTGSGAPVVAWGVWHFDELPSASTPQYADSSGNGRALTGSAADTQADLVPGRGITTQCDRAISSTGYQPGTSNFCIIQVIGNSAIEFVYAAAGTNYFIRPNTDGGVYFNASVDQFPAYSGDGRTRFVAITRNGATANYQVNSANGLISSSVGAVSFGDAGSFSIMAGFGGSSACSISFDAHLMSAVNAPWLEALYRNIVVQDLWDTTPAISSTIILPPEWSIIRDQRNTLARM